MTTTDAPDSQADPAGTPSAARPVIVGVDDSAGSEAAVRWAAREAALLGVALHVVRAYTWALQYPWASPTDRHIEANLQRVSEKITRHAMDQARTCAPDLEIRHTVVEAQAPNYLEQLADSAAMIVVGSHHLGLLGRATLGSVSAAVAARASCPVIVVCGPAGANAELPKVVVGLDPIHGAQEVLSFAFEYAARHDLPLQPVMCWHPDGLARAQWRAQPRPPERAYLWLSQALAGWQERYPTVSADAVIELDHPVAALVSASTAQDLLIVGRHGNRAHFGSFLGSVSQGVLHHASCPVAVVPIDTAD